MASEDKQSQVAAWSRNRKNWLVLPTLRSIVTILFLTIGAILSAFPIYYMIVSSTFSPEQYFYFPPKLLPGSNGIENYSYLLFETNFPRAWVNSLIFAGGSTIGVLAVASSAGYAFAWFQFPGREPLFYLTLVALAIPFQLIAIPLFDILVTYGMIDTYSGAILPALTHPLAIIFMKQNMEQALVKDLLNSGRVDGASELQIFIYIVLPLVKPALAALGVLMFLLRMNVLFWPLVVFRSSEMEVATMFLARLNDPIVPPDWSVVMPAAFLATIPVLVIFIFLQKHFVTGLLSGSVKQ